MKFPLLAFAFVVLVSCAQDTARIKTAIQTAYNAQSAAYAKRDAAGVMRYLSANYIDVNTDGDTNHDAYETLIKRLFATGARFTVTVKVTDVRMEAIQAVVTANRHFVAGGLNPLKPDSNFVQDEVLEDLWVQEKGQWLKTQSTVVSSEQPK
jgi:hypothetical protein